MSRLLALSCAVVVSTAGCTCGNFVPVDDCNGAPCPDGGRAGGTPGTGGGSAAGGSAAGGNAAGGDAGGSAAGGSAAGGSAAGGSAAGGSAAGGSAAGGNAGGATAGGSAAGGSAGGSTAGGAAAGGSAAGGSAGGGTASDGGVYDFCAEVAQRECDFYIRCAATGTLFGDPVTGRANNVASATQRSLCEATRRDSCRIEQAGEARGRRATNLTALRACLDAQFPSASCQRDRNAALSVCDLNAFTTPLAAPGSICTSSDECAGGYCNIQGGNAACAQCVRFNNPDGGTAACNSSTQCAPGTFCRGGPGPDLCAPLGGADAGCASTADCARGYVCPQTGGFNRSCVLGKLEGELCVKGRSECFRSNPNDFELVCATQPGVMDGGADRCFKRFNTTAGGFCNTAETGTNVTGPSCLDTEYCNNGLCEPRRATTQPCGTNNEVCQAGSRCFGGICTAYGDLGATCTANDQCKALLYCAGAGGVGSMGTCQPLYATTGGVCTSGGQGTPICTNASYCPGQGMQTCVAQKPNGQACQNQNNVECLNGSCNGACGNACWK